VKGYIIYSPRVFIDVLISTIPETEKETLFPELKDVVKKEEYLSPKWDVILANIIESLMYYIDVPAKILEKWGTSVVPSGHIYSALGKEVKVKEFLGKKNVMIQEAVVSFPFNVYRNENGKWIDVFRGEGHIVIEILYGEDFEKAKADEDILFIKSAYFDAELVSSPLPEKKTRKYICDLESFVEPSQLLYGIIYDFGIYPIAFEVRFKGLSPLGIVLIHTDIGTLAWKVNTEYIEERDIEEWMEMYGLREVPSHIEDSLYSVVAVLDIINRSDITREKIVEKHRIDEETLEEIRKKYNDFTALVFTLPYFKA